MPRTRSRESKDAGFGWEQVLEERENLALIDRSHVVEVSQEIV